MRQALATSWFAPAGGSQLKKYCHIWQKLVEKDCRMR
jgi:hypothetical protein